MGWLPGGCGRGSDLEPATSVFGQHAKSSLGVELLIRGMRALSYRVLDRRVGSLRGGGSEGSDSESVSRRAVGERRDE